MAFIDTGIEGLKVFEPRVFGDERGYFFESFNQKAFSAAGITDTFVQDNQSKSTRGVLRGLHYQRGESAQSKLVRVISGEVLDVAVDIRKNSPTFGKHFSIILSEDNQKQLYIPQGFAHGFVVLSETAIFFYKCDNFYNKASEGGIRFDDPTLNIDWQIDSTQIQLSDKDSILPHLGAHLSSGIYFKQKDK
jgi:dTDP-4-dehydrorhamnose 3,5-epimerase